MTQHILHRLFSPRSVAIVGAGPADDSVGGRVYRNLLDGGFPGPLYPVNPTHAEINGHACYSSLSGINAAVDLAVIATPAPTVETIIRQCGECGIGAAIVISAGFGERGPEGVRREQAVLEAGRRHGVRLLGPNCLGLMNTAVNLNATFSKNIARPGPLALISQSGAICTAILDWADSRQIGFSSIVSIGAAADVGFGDVLDYLAEDNGTGSILLYVEGIRNARQFINGLRRAAYAKPVIVLKAGRHQSGGLAAMTHTGAMVGADDVFDAALARTGAVRVMTIEQLFTAASLLAVPRTVTGDRLAIISNGGGLGVMATDHATDVGIPLAGLSDQTLQTLNQILPESWSHANPVDLLGDANADRYRAAVSACVVDPGVDGLLVMLSPQAMTDTQACAAGMIEAVRGNNKPVLACWMGGKQVAVALPTLDSAGIPNFDSPEASIEGFAHLTAWYHNQQSLRQSPPPLDDLSRPDINTARRIIDTALTNGRSLLDTHEVRTLLQSFNIPITRSLHCASLENALNAATELSYPVVMKIDSPDISHKSDVGGVVLDIRTEESLRLAYRNIISAAQQARPTARINGVTIEPMCRTGHGRELIAGVTTDIVFGPVVTFGAGGISVEIVRDRSVALPPLNNLLTRQMIARTRIAALLGPYRDVPGIDMNALIQVIRRVSEMVTELPEIVALDINPLIAHEHGVIALDARVQIARVSERLPRYGHLAIEPEATKPAA